LKHLYSHNDWQAEMVNNNFQDFVVPDEHAPQKGKDEDVQSGI